MKVLPKAFHEPHLPPFSLSKLNASGFLVNILTLHGAVPESASGAWVFGPVAADRAKEARRELGRLGHHWQVVGEIHGFLIIEFLIEDFSQVQFAPLTLFSCWVLCYVGRAHPWLLKQVFGQVLTLTAGFPLVGTSTASSVSCDRILFGLFVLTCCRLKNVFVLLGSTHHVIIPTFVIILQVPTQQ